MNKKLWSGLSSVFVFFLCFAIIGNSVALSYAGTINGFLGISTSKVVQTEGEGETVRIVSQGYGELNGDNLKRLLADTYAQSVAEGEEGMVLLRNERSALPLGSEEMSVTLFGHAVAQPLYRNKSAGSSAYQGEEGVDLYEALTAAGFRVNDALYGAYVKSPTARTGGGGTTTNALTGPWSLGEESLSFYTQELRNSWAEDYNDAAIVMFAREGGEGAELAMADPAEGISQLALHRDEKDLLGMIRDSGRFKKIIVLLNSGNPMEVGWLEEYGVDACLWIGCPGQKGFVSLANLLTGAANPSGRITDTYAVNSKSAPACVNNSGKNQKWKNLKDVQSKFTDVLEEASYYAAQAEGIYVGYKYYETRYEDLVLGRFGADGKAGSSTKKAWNYTDEVTYPFGWGLSYTTFEQTLDGVTVGEDAITVKVTVTNTGSAAGKSVVQIYAQTPYGDYEMANRVEKSAIQLLDFGKTKSLKPGESETLEIVCDKYLLASYDYTGVKGYYLSEGGYYLAIGDSAHDALNNVLAAKGAQGMVDTDGNAAPGQADKAYMWSEQFNSEKYRASRATGAVVTNQFDDCDLNYWIDGAITYLSRSDWQGTYPAKATKVSITDEMIAKMNGYLYVKPEDAPSLKDINQNVNQGLQLVNLRGLDYDDEIWETYLDQYNVHLLASLLPDMDGNPAIPEMGKPDVLIGDGPDGIGGLYSNYDAAKYGFAATSTCYPGETTLAATFNKELLANRGACLAEEATFLGLMEIWAPGGNLHRTPFGGRNFEYYSEDANMNYLCSIPEVQAMEARGIVAGIKHCVGNDQENNRIGVSCYFNEQAFRENGLRAFEGAVAVAGASSVMQSFSRLGPVGCSTSAALNKTVLRDEWGLEGIIITDAVSSVTEGYRGNYVDQLASGTDSICIDFSNVSAPIVEAAIVKNDDGYLYGELRRAAKNMLYCAANSPAMDGYSANTKIVSVTPWWQPTLIATIVVFGVLTAGSLVLLTLSLVKTKQRKQKGAVS